MEAIDVPPIPRYNNKEQIEYMNYKRNSLKNILPLVCIIGLFLAAGCKKDYYKDTGVHKPNYDGTVLEYLESRPDYFDSIVKIIKLADMEQIFDKEEITFFAPADSSVNYSIAYVNERLKDLGRPQIHNLEQVSPVVWRKYLSRYVFKGKKSMSDYRQIDPENLSAYPGQIYASYDGLLMNIGVVYGDAGGVKYAGYRQLHISFIPSASTPLDYSTWYSAYVASVNIAPTNGYVHALRYPLHYFGFSPSAFLEDVLAEGVTP